VELDREVEENISEVKRKIYEKTSVSSTRLRFLKNENGS